MSLSLELPQSYPRAPHVVKWTLLFIDEMYRYNMIQHGQVAKQLICFSPRLFGMGPHDDAGLGQLRWVVAVGYKFKRDGFLCWTWLAKISTDRMRKKTLFVWIGLHLHVSTWRNIILWRVHLIPGYIIATLPVQTRYFCKCPFAKFVAPRNITV